MDSKQELRARMKALCAAVSAEERQAGARKASEALCAEPWFQRASAIFSYAALPDEADAEAVHQCVLRGGKRLALPRIVRGAEAEMEFCFVGARACLVSNALNVLEPPPGAVRAPLVIDNLLVIVPGRAFTRDGKRLGRGKGFYDRFLSRLKTAFSLTGCSLILAGYCYDFQITDDIPVERHDIMMDYVLTAPSPPLGAGTRG